MNDNYYRASGITLVIQRLLHSGPFQDVDVFLAGCSAWEGRETSVEELALVAPQRYKQFSLMGGPFKVIPELIRFAGWLREMQCDLIHVHHRRLAVYANLLRYFTHVPVLFTGHLTFPDAPWFRYLAPTWMTGVSPSVARYLKQHTRVKELSVIYNPLGFNQPASDLRAFPSPRVISIGRLDPVKGHATLIEAWSLLKQAGISAKLDIYGEGPLRSSLTALIHARDLEEDVHLCGFASDLEHRLSSYAFNVLVSSTEGFPNAVLEAASRSMPSLLNDVEGSRDALPPDLALPNGLRCGDVNQLSSALAAWLTAPQLVVDDGVRFYQHLRAMCCPEEVSKSYIALYKRMLRKDAGQHGRISEATSHHEKGTVRTNLR